MDIRRFLPSAQFTLIITSLVLSGGLVIFSERFTHPTPPPSTETVQDTATVATSADWLQNLRDIQAQNGTSLPQPPSQDSVNELLTAAQSTNITDTVARTLLVNISNAKSQGLGGDIPTQDSLITAALQQAQPNRGLPAYKKTDLTVSDNGKVALKAYANAVISTIGLHPRASYDATIYTIGTSTDNADPSKLAPLPKIGKDYAALAQDLAKVPVPPTLLSFHLQIVNNVKAIAETYPDIMTLYDDPLKGLAAFQLYDALNQETMQVFINIAHVLQQNAILFNKDEPGSAWASFVSQ